MRRLIAPALAVAALAAPAMASAAAPVVWVQAGHAAPGEPGYSAQTGAGGGPFGSEAAFNVRVRNDMVTRLRAAGVIARPLVSKVNPMGARGATFISIHFDQQGGAGSVGRAVLGGGENYYHGEGTGDARQTPYPDSGTHRTPATTVSAAVARRSASLAAGLSSALAGIHTAANGASSPFLGVVPVDGNTRETHYYGYYRTNAEARVLVEVGAAGNDDPFLRKVPLIGATLTKAIVKDLKARKLLSPQGRANSQRDTSGVAINPRR
jgi:hypothetical protein